MEAHGSLGDEDDPSQNSFPSTDFDPLSEITEAAHKLFIGDKASEHELCDPSCVLKRNFTWGINKIPQRQLDNLQAPSEARLQSLAEALYQNIHPWQTRILKLRAGSFDDRIICDLLVVDLIAATGIGIVASSEIIEYEALSYSWGWPEYTSSVCCNGSDFPVTQHLADALRHLRSVDEARYLWTDAFCINQKDDKEKSRQVQNMLLVFQKAVRVVAWLGIEQGEDVDTFAALKALSKIGIASGKHQTSCYENFNRIRKAADRIVGKSWFSRTWVRQEVFATDQVVLYCGSHSIRFEEFVGGFRELRYTALPDEYRSEPKTNLAEYRCFDNLQKLYSKHYAERGPWPYTVLRIFLEGAAFGVTNPRDRVYGMMGMVLQYQRASMLAKGNELWIMRDTRNIQTIPIDYGKTTSGVFQDFVKFLVEQSGSLDILTVLQDKTDRESDLPSWVIDLEHLRSFVTVKDPITIRTRLPSLRSLEAEGPQELRLRGFRLRVTLPLERMELPRDFAARKSRSSHDERSLGSLFHELRTVAECLQACSYVHGKPGQVSETNPVKQLWRYTVAVPRTAKDGDFFAVLYGGSFPFLLRPHLSTPDRYILVGPVVFLLRTSKHKDALNYSMGIDRVMVRFGFFSEERFRFANEEDFTLV